MQKYNNEDYNWWSSPANNSAKEIVPFLLEYFTIKSVIDYGCASGEWLAVFKDFGIQRIQGLDGIWMQPENLKIPSTNFKTVDLSTHEHESRERFDLSISLEVAEHLDSDASNLLVSNLTTASDLVLFSAAIPGQGGQHHINEQPPNYWKKKFEVVGFKQFDILRGYFWDNENISWWYRQNIMLYSKNCIMDKFRHQFQNLHGIHLIHPVSFKEKCNEISIENASISNLLKTILYKIMKRLSY
jgi:hypothetical protein